MLQGYSEQTTSASSGIHHPVRLLHAVSQWFLYQHVLACLQRRNNQRRVKGMRRRDGHEVGRLAQRRIEVRIRGRTDSFRDLLGALLDDVLDRDNLSFNCSDGP